MGATPLSLVCHRGTPVNVFNFGHGDRYFVLFWVCPINPNVPVQSSVVTFPVLRLLLEFSHRHLCRCEKYGRRVPEPSRTVAAKPPRTCCLVHEMPVVWMVKVGVHRLFRDQHVHVALCTAYGYILQVYLRADLLQ